MATVTDLNPAQSLFDQSHEDYEMQKSLLSALWKMARNPDALRLIAASDFIMVLAQYVQVRPSRGWSEPQLEEIQSLTMAVLADLGPLMVDEFSRIGCIERLLRFFAWSVHWESRKIPTHDKMISRATEKVDEPGVRPFAGACNDFFDADDFSHGLTRLTAYWNNGRRAQQRSCLRLMRNMMDTGDARIMLQLAEHGAIPLLRAYIARPFPDFSIAVDQLCVRLRTDAMLILSSLCDFSQQNRVSGVESMWLFAI